jgi:DNA-binding transcriptional ArsR family regulator
VTGYEAVKQAELLRVLGCAPRLMILAMLHKSHTGMTTLEIVEELGYLAQPSVSHHLGKLRRAGLIAKAEDDSRAPNRLVRGRLDDVVELLRGLT